MTRIIFDLQELDFEKVGIVPQFCGNKGQINSNIPSAAKAYEPVSCHGRNLEIKNVFQVIYRKFHFQCYQVFGQIKPFLISKFQPCVRTSDPISLILGPFYLVCVRLALKIGAIGKNSVYECQRLMLIPFSPSDRKVKDLGLQNPSKALLLV